MIPSLSIGPRTLLNDCNHSATAIFWRSAIQSTAVGRDMRPWREIMKGSANVSPTFLRLTSSCLLDRQSLQPISLRVSLDQEFCRRLGPRSA